MEFQGEGRKPADKGALPEGGRTDLEKEHGLENYLLGSTGVTFD